jgi:hypothetical protein
VNNLVHFGVNNYSEKPNALRWEGIHLNWLFVRFQNPELNAIFEGTRPSPSKINPQG